MPNQLAKMRKGYKPPNREGAYKLSKELREIENNEQVLVPIAWLKRLLELSEDLDWNWKQSSGKDFEVALSRLIGYISSVEEIINK